MSAVSTLRSMKDRRFFAGDAVVVRPPEEILETLDGDGTLDGCPFMPEMLDWCGKPFRVQRRVEKTCVTDHPMRRFRADDVVILDGPRCDGRHHDGCKHGCRIFWKEAWLRHADRTNGARPITEFALEPLRARLKVKSDEHHYFCQSTELFKATEAFPGKQKLWTIRIVLKEIRRGDLSVSEIMRLCASWYTMRLRRALSGRHWLFGPHTKTPSESLELKPGEPVRVRDRAHILRTLDTKGRNRGMVICDEMTRCCGSDAEVRYRVDRLIDERTGIMLSLSDTVTLQNVGRSRVLSEECQCYDQLGDCPRGELMYWREIWLERLNRDQT